MIEDAFTRDKRETDAAPLLHPDEERELLKQYHTQHDQDALHQLVKSNQRLIIGRSSEKTLHVQLQMTCIPMSSRQVCCDRPTVRPLETWVQPIQASPCVQDLRCITLHTSACNRVLNMLFSL